MKRILTIFAIILLSLNAYALECRGRKFRVTVDDFGEAMVQQANTNWSFSFESVQCGSPRFGLECRGSQVNNKGLKATLNLTVHSPNNGVLSAVGFDAQGRSFHVYDYNMQCSGL